MSAPPYMKLYIADYLADTTHLSCLEHGAYLMLLMAMWRAGGKLPNKDVKLAAITRLPARDWAKIRPAIMELFTVSGGAIKHKRLAKELAHYSTVIEGRKRAQKRTHSETVNENKDKASDFAGQNKGKRPHNQNQNQKGRVEPSKKGSTSSRRESADERADGSSASRSDVIDLDALREEIAEAERQRVARLG